MSITFTQAHIKLDIDIIDMPKVIKSLNVLLEGNLNKPYKLETQIHINSVDKANKTLVEINKLHRLGVLNQSRWQELSNRLENFKKMYLK